MLRKVSNQGSQVLAMAFMSDSKSLLESKESRPQLVDQVNTSIQRKNIRVVVRRLVRVSR
jgi:hypothetical protein